MKTWEYVSLNLRHLEGHWLEAKLNEYGRNGWEVVAVASTGEIILKRARKNEGIPKEDRPTF